MKKRVLAVSIGMACMLFAAACAKTEEPAEPQEEVVVEETVEVEETNKIVPLPATVDVNNLEECTVAVSFGKNDISTSDSGEMQIKVKVYTYDLYDMVDISMLEEGSVIEIQGEDVEVSAIEHTDMGVIINGGLDNGGYELHTDDSTVFYEMGYSDALSYYEIGEATLPVAEDFVFIDTSDLDKGEVTYDAKDLLENDEIIDSFTPNDTKLVIEDGSVIVMERIYRP